MATYFQFDFAVEGLTQAEADELLDKIIEFAEEHGAIIGGGFHKVTEADDGTEGTDGTGTV